MGIGDAHLAEQNGIYQNGGQKVHGNPGKQHGDALPGVGSRHAAGNIRIVLPFDLIESAQRDPVEGEVGAFPGEEFYGAWGESDPKFFDFDTHQAGDDEMPELM